jgi:hypothetical protein
MKHVDEANAEQPVQLDVGVLQAGANPVQLVQDAINHIPGGTP